MGSQALEGHHESGPLFRYLRGRPWTFLFHTSEFLCKKPRDSVKNLGLNTHHCVPSCLNTSPGALSCSTVRPTAQEDAPFLGEETMPMNFWI